MLRFKNSLLRVFWNKSIAWKLSLLNALLLALVIWITGVSVKDFACLLFGNIGPATDGQREFFNQTMNIYLLRSITLALFLYTVFYLYIFKRMLKPLRKLATSTKQLIHGVYPEPLPIYSHDEIGSLTSDFNELVVRLQSIEQQRKKLVADVAHELRTPLTNINGYLEALHSGVINGDHELFQSLYEESQRLTRLVEQLHEMNVIEANTITLQDINIRTLLDTMIKKFELEILSKNITVTMSIESINVKSNEDMLTQIFMNLLKNALLYNRSHCIEINGRIQGNTYRIEIANEGLPLTELEKNQLFDRFYRVEPSRNRMTGGAGLGLAIVKEYIERLEGKVGVTYKENVYTFWIELPIRSM